jgi:hypothetical protein
MSYVAIQLLVFLFGAGLLIVVATIHAGQPQRARQRENKPLTLRGSMGGAYGHRGRFRSLMGYGGRQLLAVAGVLAIVFLVLLLLYLISGGFLVGIG